MHDNRSHTSNQESSYQLKSPNQRYVQCIIAQYESDLTKRRGTRQDASQLESCLHIATEAVHIRNSGLTRDTAPQHSCPSYPENHVVYMLTSRSEEMHYILDLHRCMYVGAACVFVGQAERLLAYYINHFRVRAMAEAAPGRHAQRASTACSLVARCCSRSTYSGSIALLQRNITFRGPQ